tara:strand:- start:2040 stop:2207 length:168 start_codon:yes stop_codon:yes gene_type:complete
MKVYAVCAACGEEDDWEGFEEMVQVNAQVGNIPKVIIVGGCACGHQQQVEDVTEE